MAAAQLHPLPPRPKWSILGLAHPDAKLLLGIDWKRALASSMGPVIRKQVALGGHPRPAFLDSIDNVERFLVLSPGWWRGVGDLRCWWWGRQVLAGAGAGHGEGRWRGVAAVQ